MSFAVNLDVNKVFVSSSMYIAVSGGKRLLAKAM
jgi:hypothetical protein